MELRKTISNKNGIAASLLCIAELKRFEGENQDAIDALQKSYAIAKEIGDKDQIASLLYTDG